jgi:hypothetical protein
MGVRQALLEDLDLEEYDRTVQASLSYLQAQIACRPPAEVLR